MKITPELLKSLQRAAIQIRKDTIESLALAGSGHPGGALSDVEILTALYWQWLRHDPKNPSWPDRDRFFLSKGHACASLYAVLAEHGYFPREELKRFRKLGGMLQGHPDRLKTPGIEFSTGSLGHGLSVGIGTALAARLDGKDYRTYVLLGDGEIQEGEVWEAISCASHYRLDNLCALLDNNNLQIDGSVDQIMNIDPLDKRLIAFGWHFIDIDGHNYPQIFNALEEAQRTQGQPTFIRARTIKGKGVSFMENEVEWHGVAPKPDEARRALAELDTLKRQLETP